jgi:biotin carboxylase
MTAARTQRLIVDYEHGVQSVFSLKEAAGGLCELIWLIDVRTPEMPQLARLMARMGTVIDMSDRSEAQLVDDLRALDPTGLLNLSDRSGMMMARLAQALGLEFHSPLVAGRLFDKLHQREALRAGGVPCPAFAGVHAGAVPAEIDALAAHVGFPSVLKPRQGSASRDAYRVRGREELSRLVAIDGPFRIEEGGMILEAYLPAAGDLASRFAPIVSVESYVIGGEPRHFAVTGRLPFAEPFRETGSVLPSDLAVEPAQMAESAAGAAIVALGATGGCFHTEIKFTPEGPRIIEVNGRLGGGIPELVKLAGEDRSVLRLAMELALGVALHVTFRFSRIGWRRAVTPPVSADRIEAISGIEKLKDIPGVGLVTVNRGAGEAVDWRRGLRDFVVQIYGSGADYEEVEAQCAAVDRAVSITYGGTGTVGAGADRPARTEEEPAAATGAAADRSSDAESDAAYSAPGASD